jgi:hypothetical protein
MSYERWHSKLVCDCGNTGSIEEWENDGWAYLKNPQGDVTIEKGDFKKISKNVEKSIMYVSDYTYQCMKCGKEVTPTEK